MSLEEASFDSWIKFYRRDEHSINSQISYYVKGLVVSAMLDLEIRGRTKGAKSFDDVLRYLWETHASKGAGVPEDGVQPAVEAVAGSAFQDFFDRYIRGTAEIDYNSFLKHAGMRLVTEVKKDDARLDPAQAGAWLGASITDANGQAVVQNVMEDSPAWRAGLNAGDQVVALDGFRVTAAALPERLADRRAGDTVALTVFRRDELRTIKVVLGARPADTYKIEKVPEPGPAKVGKEGAGKKASKPAP
jgi:predicted metalloprotease with PDZ domain